MFTPTDVEAGASTVSVYRRFRYKSIAAHSFSHVTWPPSWTKLAVCRLRCTKPETDQLRSICSPAAALTSSRSKGAPIVGSDS